MSVHIGKIVAAHLEEHGISKKHLADKINRSRDYVYKVLERSYISTEDLYAISQALEHNFFWYFAEKLTDYPPTVTLRTDTEEQEKLTKELEHFKKENAYLLEINKLLKDKIAGKDE